MPRVIFILVLVTSCFGLFSLVRMVIEAQDGLSLPAQYVELKKKADNGDADAQYTLARDFEKGESVKKNLLLAGEYYKKASDSGIQPATEYINNKNKNCLALTDPQSSEVDECVLAAAARFPQAREQLALFYTKGLGVPIHIPQAHAWTFTYLSHYKDEDDVQHRTVNALMTLAALGRVEGPEKKHVNKKIAEYLEKYGKR